jgi:hypothetical protein
MPLKALGGDFPTGGWTLDTQKVHNFLGCCMGSDRVRRVGRFDEYEFG